jgi:hypothetical protein
VGSAAGWRVERMALVVLKGSYFCGNTGISLGFGLRAREVYWRVYECSVNVYRTNYSF